MMDLCRQEWTAASLRLRTVCYNTNAVSYYMYGYCIATEQMTIQMPVDVTIFRCEKLVLIVVCNKIYYRSYICFQY